jgi:glycerol-3-phosphate cytidylyltransferase
MAKYKIGYTTGVYDMFHIGHLNILKRAKAECDHLIVGVSTDELVQKSKGHLPVVPFEDRCAIVAAMKYVDEVVPQVDKNKFGAWEKYRFNAMFVGDDWKNKPIFMEAEKKLNEVGVDVVYFPYTSHISSTKLREEMKEEKSK